MLRFKIWEYQVTWNSELTKRDRGGKIKSGGWPYRIEMHQINQKEFIGQKNT